MKRILPILLLLLCFGCASAQAEQQPLKKTVATVTDIHSGFATLDGGGKQNYRVPAGELELGKWYVFWLEVADCGNCSTAAASVAGYALTTWQAQEDQRKISEKLSNRIILK